MSYSKLPYDKIEDLSLRKIFYHADKHLSDVYGMFHFLLSQDKDGDDGLFSITLVLLCVIDGLAAEIWPGGNRVKSRFTRLVKRRLNWGTANNEKWLDKGKAADQLYEEFRNPLVHNLAGEDLKRHPAGNRPEGNGEPVIVPWGLVPKNFQSIDQIDGLAKWNDDWPILADSPGKEGERRYNLVVSGLYWAVKDMATTMAKEQISIEAAEESSTE